MAYLFLWSVKRRSTILKCCNRPHHATAALAEVEEAAITKVHAPPVALTALTATPVPRIRKIVQNTGIYCFLKLHLFYHHNSILALACQYIRISSPTDGR